MSLSKKNHLRNTKVESTIHIILALRGGQNREGGKLGDLIFNVGSYDTRRRALLPGAFR